MSFAASWAVFSPDVLITVAPFCRGVDALVEQHASLGACSKPRRSTERAEATGCRAFAGHDVAEILRLAQLVEEAGKARVAAGGRAPLDVHDLGAERGEVGGKQFEPDVDDAQRRREQIVWRIAVLLVHRRLWMGLAKHGWAPPCQA